MVFSINYFFCDEKMAYKKQIKEEFISKWEYNTKIKWYRRGFWAGGFGKIEKLNRHSKATNFDFF